VVAAMTGAVTSTAATAEQSVSLIAASENAAVGVLLVTEELAATMAASAAIAAFENMHVFLLLHKA
jgi:hypothetical protein